MSVLDTICVLSLLLLIGDLSLSALIQSNKEQQSRPVYPDVNKWPIALWIIVGVFSFFWIVFRISWGPL